MATPSFRWTAAAVFGAVLAILLQLTLSALAADPEPSPPPPPPPEVEIPVGPIGWDMLEFKEPIPAEWGTVFSINRVEKGGESYTFWFLAPDGTLRGVTTREFTGSNRASFFPEVYVIRRK